MSSRAARENEANSESQELPFAYAAAGSGEAPDVVGDLLVLRTQPTEEAPMLALETTVAPGGGPPPTSTLPRSSS